MKKNPYELACDRLRARLSSLSVEGEVLEKSPSTGGVERTPGGVLAVRFKDRSIELPVGADEFNRTRVGDRIQFSPPVLEKPPCNCHCAICTVVGLVIGIAVALAIATRVEGYRGRVLSVAAAGWIGTIVWAVVSTHQRRRYLRALENEISFYQGGGKRENASHWKQSIA